MLLLGGAATVEALTGMNYELASFLIPWGVILYTSAGGLKATFMASYLHTMIIFAVLITMITIVYIKVYSADQIYDYLDQTVSYSEEQCQGEIVHQVVQYIVLNEQNYLSFIHSFILIPCSPLSKSSQR